MYELVYTSTPQGLLTGRSGFTTVALTEGFPPNLIALIENLSGYKTLFEHGSEHEQRNPVNFSCQPFTLGRTSYVVLSRISYAGISYTGRSNVLAHHLIFTEEELDEIPGGAITVLRTKENFPEWSGKPRMFPLKHRIDSRPLPHDAKMWQKLAGSAQWASYTAECFRADPDKGLVLAFDPLRISGDEILELFAETAAHLTQAELRHFTFSTYCYSSGITNPLFFRSYVNDSPLLGSIRRLEPDSIIYLGTDNPLPRSWTERTLPSCGETDQLCPEDEEEVGQEPAPFSADTSPDPAAGPMPGAGLPNEPVRPPRSGTPPCDGPIPEPAETQQEPPQDGSKIKRPMIALVIAALVLGLCAAVFWHIFHHPPTPDPDAQDHDILLDKKDPDGPSVPLPPKTAAGSQTPASGETETEPQTPPQKPADSASAGPGRKKTEPLASAGKAAAPKKVAAGPSAREVLDLYRHFRKGGKQKLPAALRDTVALEVELRSVGGLKKEDIDQDKLPSFASGNGTKRVEVYAPLAKNTDLAKEWVPDKSKDKNKMIFQLVPEDSLEIIFPKGSSGTVPQLTDVSTITFARRDGTRYVFHPNQLPSGLAEFLKGEIAITVKCDNESIFFYLKVSDDLRANSTFYSIRVNGKNPGDINQSELLLHTVRLSGVRAALLTRNNQVDQLRKIKSEEENFVSGNAQDLEKPELKNRRLQEKFADEAKFQELQTAASNSSDDDWHLHVNEIADEIISKLPKAVQRQEKSKIRKDVTADLNRYRKHWLKYRECTKRLAEIRAKIADCRNEIGKQNKSLLDKLAHRSPALHHVASETLKESDDPAKLDPDFYRNIPEQELKKDVKVEIIRKRTL